MVGQNKPPTITFQNGSEFTMVESENKNVRGKRAELIWYCDEDYRKRQKKMLKEIVDSLNLKWHQKLRICIGYYWGEFVDWIIRRIK